MSGTWPLRTALVLVALGTGARSRGVAEEPKKVALLVGVDVYRSRLFAEKPLRYAERDAFEMGAVLKGQGFDLVKVLTGASATRAGIDEALAELLSGRAADDLVLIGFSGHGVQSALADDRGRLVLDDRGRELSEAYFCPADAVLGRPETMISLTRLMGRLDREGGVNLMLVDACRDDPAEAEKRGLRSLSGNDLVGRLPRDSVILFSCSAGQRALETDKAGGGHGVFFHHVIEGLNGKAADLETGEVAWLDLISYLSKNVNRRAREWDPEEAKRVDAHPRTRGRLQNPHMVSNLIANPVLARVGPARRAEEGRSPGEERDDNALKMAFRWCPSGSFLMGSPSGEAERGRDEDQVRVTLSRGFWIGKYEVTQEQWRSVMGASIQDQVARSGGTTALRGEGPTHPIYLVSHREAEEFCARLTATETAAGRLPARRAYRLPTEAEWEYACRAGTTTASSFGDKFGGVDANIDGRYPYGGAPVGPYLAKTVPVGGYRPNSWGLFDMQGNLHEWCRDVYNGTLPGGTDPRGPATDGNRVFRGGSWDSFPHDARAASRRQASSDYRHEILGFRVVRE